MALLPLGDARGGADGRQARAVGLVARGPLPARVLRPLRPFARPGAGARVARHGARPRGVARARLARRARRRRGARRHGLRRPGALGGPRRRLVFWGRASGRDDDARDREPTTTPAQVLKKDVTNGGRRGDRVAVKVVHPAARRRVASDLDFLRACARAGEALIPRAKWFNLAAAADEFAATLGAQMDMRAARGRRPETRLLVVAGGATRRRRRGGSHASKTSRETTKHRDT